MLKNSLLRFSVFTILLFAISCKPYYSLKYTSNSIIAVDTITTPVEDPAALKILEPYQKKIHAELNEILAYSDEAMDKDLPEGKLNNFVTDLTLLISRKHYKPEDGQTIDMCVLNSGGLRSALPKGAITISKVFELMPFENQLVVLTMTGKETLDMLNWIASNGGVPLAGVKMGIKNEKAIDVLTNGVAFNVERNYKIVTSDYLASGGDKYSFFKNPLKYEEIGLLARDAIIEYMRDENAAGRTVKATLDKRIYYVR